jgi:hypothetical protein
MYNADPVEKSVNAAVRSCHSANSRRFHIGHVILPKAGWRRVPGLSRVRALLIPFTA